MLHEVPAGAKAWLVVFHRHSTRWVEALCPGRFKHVSLAGFVPGPDIWVVVSWELGRLRVALVRDDEFEAWLPTWAGPGAGCLLAPAPPYDRGPWIPRLGLFCVSASMHVLGVRGGALRPDGLWRLLLRHGAELIADGTKDRDAQADGVGEGADPAGGSRPA